MPSGIYVTAWSFLSTNALAGSWVGTGNLYADDASYVTFSSSSAGSGNGRWENPATAFNVPSYAIISGIELEIEFGPSHSGFTGSNTFFVTLATGGSTKGTAAEMDSNGPGVFYNGGSTDLWGTTWTAAEVNAATFGVNLNASWVSGSISAQIDYVRVRIYYTLPDIYYVGASATPSGLTATTTTTTLTLTYPTCLANDLLVCGVGVKPDTASISTPADWDDVSNAEASGGGGTTGADTGPTRLKLFKRRVPAGGLSGTFNITLGSSPNVAWGMILVFRGPSASGYDCAAANGVDTTTGTPFTAAMGSDPGILQYDMVAIFGCIPTDVSTPSQFSSPTLTGTGLTATVTEQGEPDTNSGNDIGGVVCTAEVSASLTSGNPTFSTTAGGTTTNVRGPIVIMRVRTIGSTNPRTRETLNVLQAVNRSAVI